MPVVEAWSSSPIEGEKAPTRKWTGFRPEYCTQPS